MNKLDKMGKMEKAARPLIKYLAENHHPHITAIVTSDKVEILEGIISKPIKDYILD